MPEFEQPCACYFTAKGNSLNCPREAGASNWSAPKTLIRVSPQPQITRYAGLFYVEGSFFNDMRETGACDLSAPIRRFCYEHGIAPPAVPHAVVPGDYSTADMAGASFQDLWLRAGGGTGYVYYHQARLLGF